MTQTDGSGEKPLSHTQLTPRLQAGRQEACTIVRALKKKKNINPGSLNAVTKGYIIFHGTY